MSKAQEFLAVLPPFIAAVDAVPDDLLEAKAPGEAWTVWNVLVHLADAEAQAYVRLRTIVADADPQLINYDENRWVESLPSDFLDRASAKALLTMLRQANASLIERLTPEDLQKTGTHSIRGAISLAALVDIYTEHVAVHTRQVERIHKALKNA